MTKHNVLVFITLMNNEVTSETHEVFADSMLEAFDELDRDIHLFSGKDIKSTKMFDASKIKVSSLTSSKSLVR